MTRTYYSIGSAIAQPLGMSQCWTNELRECGSSWSVFVVSYAEPKMNLTTQIAKCIGSGHLRLIVWTTSKQRRVSGGFPLKRMNRFGRLGPRVRVGWYLPVKRMQRFDRGGQCWCMRSRFKCGFPFGWPRLNLLNENSKWFHSYIVWYGKQSLPVSI